MKIIVDYRALDKKGDILIEKAEDLKTYINQMTNQIERFQNCWVGKDSIEFQNNIKEEHINSLMKLQETILSYGQYLKRISMAYQNLDNVFLNKKISTLSKYR